MIASVGIQPLYNQYYDGIKNEIKDSFELNYEDGSREDFKKRDDNFLKSNESEEDIQSVVAEISGLGNSLNAYV